MIVIGLDTDSKGYHWVSTAPLPDAAEDKEPIKAGYFIVTGDAERRRAAVAIGARQFFRNAIHLGARMDQEVHVFCEEPLALQNGKTTRVLGLAAGAIWAGFVFQGSAPPIGRYWHWVDVAHWKKEVVGKGNVDKEGIRRFVRGNPAWLAMVKESPDLDAMFEEDKDLYDAWCLKLHGSRQLLIAGRE